MGYQSKKHVLICPYVRPRIVRTQHKCAVSPESRGYGFRNKSSSSKFIRDDYSPWTALDVVRVSTRAMIRYL